MLGVTLRVCADEAVREDGATCSHVEDAATSEPGLWNNRAFQICRENAAGKEAAFDKRLEKLAQVGLDLFIPKLFFYKMHCPDLRIFSKFAVNCIIPAAGTFCI